MHPMRFTTEYMAEAPLNSMQVLRHQLLSRRLFAHVLIREAI